MQQKVGVPLLAPILNAPDRRLLPPHCRRSTQLWSQQEVSPCLAYRRHYLHLTIDHQRKIFRWQPEGHHP